MKSKQAFSEKEIKLQQSMKAITLYWSIHCTDTVDQFLNNLQPDTEIQIPMN